MPTTLTPSLISAAIEGFQAQKARIDSQIAELRAMLPGAAQTTAATTSEATAPVPKTRRQFSAAARQKMAEAQRLRWSIIKGQAEPLAPAPVEAPKPKRKLSAASKAKLVANLKKARAAKAAMAKAAAVQKPALALAPAPKPQRKKISAEGMANIIAATKRMWAAKRAAAKKV
jgi:hypothetical protein